MRDWCGHADRNKKTGRYGCYENPNAKWDWYSIGGRYSGLFKLKKNGAGKKGEKGLMGSCYCDKFNCVDIAHKKYIDFSIDKEAYKSAARFWELYIEKDKPKNDKDREIIKFVLYKKEYYLERWKDKIDYATKRASFSTFAVITEDGQWHEQGEMGWFGFSGDTARDQRKWEESYYDKFIKKLNNDVILTIVDCHI